MDVVRALVEGCWRPPYSQESVPLSLIDADPSANYRWGSPAAMQSDLALSPASLRRLETSVAATGVRDPVGLLRCEGRYQAVYGFTRITLARRLSHTEIPAQVFEKLTDLEIGIYQIQENSHLLRRKVNWVQECERYDSLVAACYDGVKKSPKDAQHRKTGKNGKLLGAHQTAQAIVAGCLGTNLMTIRKKLWYFRKLPTRIQDLCRNGIFSFYSACEFIQGGKEAYPEETIDLVLKRLDLTKPVLPDAVRKAFRAVQPPPPKRETGAASAVQTHLHPGHIREYAVHLAEERLEERHLSPESPPEELSRLEKSSTWTLIGGLALGCGAVRVPNVFEGESAKSQREKANEEVLSWVREVFLIAMVRRCLQSRVRVWRDWVLDHHSAIQLAVRSGKSPLLVNPPLPLCQILLGATEISNVLVRKG